MSTDLDNRRSDFNATLMVPFTAYRDLKDQDGISTGGDSAVTPVYGYCGVNLQGGSAGSSSFVASIRQAMSVKTPGGRTLSFTWDEDVLTGDTVRIGGNTYTLGVVNTDDPMRIGLQVDTEVQGQRATQ